ncbi:hypothetical protein SPRG_08988 [Saprolegnia parasitica CBS 223.65]|uniref:Uncharacterized protein n=1 Tax=Saprolegnia parasitica (strain CBS 223.65) TaxID=695850 RepID=A0A067C4M1_SAPPC|nr:hypothetical protein SPRG_08988 [Saprolegnia parasitica CBS 223.65]KDO25689.1 hypothetical protein SPRG_08988 [Saprolegnia parasitica CBS 223.65]|eukprot:XP_012203499.1 hypothetical protein SPRG_08988 [Saprolegnia parasitica CBS 223.65]
MGILFNISLMPIKAYLSEDLPWTRDAQWSASDNFTDFNTSTLARYQAKYNVSTLPPQCVYHNDAAAGVELVRVQMDMTTHAAIARDNCVADFLLGKPGVVYYTTSIRSLLCDLAAANASNFHLLAWQNRGTCVYNTYFGLYIGHQCVWITADDGAHTHRLTISMAIATYASTTWLWCKLAFRVGLSFVTLYLLYAKYYRHCLDLESLLLHHGHQRTSCTNLWRYEVIWGDPTAMILLNPAIAGMFALDCWLSVDTVTLAIMRASQAHEITVMLLGCLYLSRTVWFAYAALCGVNTCLKRHKKEHLFAEVDPTLVAVAATIYGPLVTWMAGNVEFFLELFHALFDLVVPSVLKRDRFDGSIPSTMYSLMLASLPVVYGFSHALLRKPRTTPRDLHLYSSFRFNSIKNRLVLCALRLLHSPLPVHVPAIGGTMHRLFELVPRYKRWPTISFRGSDCYVHCYCDGTLKERLRLSLVDDLDRLVLEANMAIHDAPEDSMYSVNVLVLPSAQRAHPLLQRPVQPSAWCL